RRPLLAVDRQCRRPHRLAVGLSHMLDSRRALGDARPHPKPPALFKHAPPPADLLLLHLGARLCFPSCVLREGGRRGESETYEYDWQSFHRCSCDGVQRVDSAAYSSCASIASAIAVAIAACTTGWASSLPSSG